VATIVEAGASLSERADEGRDGPVDESAGETDGERAVRWFMTCLAGNGLCFSSAIVVPSWGLVQDSTRASR